jgi:hypothetical protein
LSPVSGPAVAFARAVTDTSGDQCSELLGGNFRLIPIMSAFGQNADIEPDPETVSRRQRSLRVKKEENQRQSPIDCKQFVKSLIVVSNGSNSA